jgi:hypothetical protein
MAHTFLNYCDNCRRLTDILYIDEITGLELCSECICDIEEDGNGDFEYDDDD